MRSRTSSSRRSSARPELGLELLHRARPDDRRRDRRVVDHEGERQVDQRDAELVGQLPERVGGLELGLVLGDAQVVALREHRRAARGQVVGALAPLARQPAARQRAPRDHAHAVLEAGGQHVGLDPAREQRVGRLLADEALEAALARDPLRLHDLRRRVGRGADVAHLALGDEVGERAERLVVVGPRVPAVDLVEVDPVGLEALERGLDLAHDPAPRVAAPRWGRRPSSRGTWWRGRRCRGGRRPAPCRRSPRTRRASRRRRCRRS